MLNWFRPVIVVNVDFVVAESNGGESNGGNSKELRDAKFNDNILKLSVTPDFVKRHINYIYMFKSSNNITPYPMFFFEYYEGDIYVTDLFTGSAAGILQDDGTVIPQE